MRATIAALIPPRAPFESVCVISIACTVPGGSDGSDPRLGGEGARGTLPALSAAEDRGGEKTRVPHCRVGGGALARWPPSAAQTVRADFRHTAFTKTPSCESDGRWKELVRSGEPSQTLCTAWQAATVSSRHTANVGNDATKCAARSNHRVCGRAFGRGRACNTRCNTRPTPAESDLVPGSDPWLSAGHIAASATIERVHDFRSRRQGAARLARPAWPAHRSCSGGCEVTQAPLRPQTELRMTAFACAAPLE
jgi:hypothetical protein